MKITLINPPFLFISDHKLGVSQCLGLRTISSFLKQKGHKVQFIDALMLGYNHVKNYSNGFIVGLEYDDIVNRIESDSDFIGISVPFSQVAPIAHDIIAKIKSRYPHIKVIMGGVYPSTQPQYALESQADYIVVGDGESAIENLMSGISSENIEGVYTPEDKYREHFPSAPWTKDLDSIPWPDIDIPMISSYYDISPRARKDTRTAALVTSRGCPYKCSFCSVHPTAGYAFRCRSPLNIIEEINFLNKEHGVTHLEIEDDNFTLNPKRTHEILEGILKLNEKGAGLSWRTPNGVRIDSLEDETMNLIKRSGCSQLTLALEHGDQEMVSKVMNKALNLEVAMKVFKMAAKHGVNVLIFVITGYPEETLKRFNRGIKFLKQVSKLGPNFNCLVFLAQPYPGTNLLKQCIQKGYLRPPPGVSYKHFDNFVVRRDLMSTGSVVSIETPDFDKDEVLRRQKIIMELFELNRKLMKKNRLPRAGVGMVP
jgi:magnesium-protoporphyrin IX monomethyl ester (oxidative) cyclase